MMNLPTDRLSLVCSQLPFPRCSSSAPRLAAVTTLRQSPIPSSRRSAAAATSLSHRRCCPASSWKRLLGDLRNHFGDDASVDATTTARISNYLVANAGDTGGQRYSDKLLRGSTTNEAPLRITELPRWVREHRKVSDREWKDVRSRANCAGCHRAAERGYYDD
jgi:hypothetical protein